MFLNKLLYYSFYEGFSIYILLTMTFFKTQKFSIISSDYSVSSNFVWILLKFLEFSPKNRKLENWDKIPLKFVNFMEFSLKLEMKYIFYNFTVFWGNK